MDIIIPSERRLHKETHLHACSIHQVNKCKHPNPNTFCNTCLRMEENSICGKTLRGTGLEYHVFPCISCQTHYRNNFGGEMLVDALVDLEQAARHAHEVPNAKVDEREDRDAETNDEVEELVNARKRI